ncbi:MAG TPA: NAD(P)-dependent oxidoreductase [Deltaproteobacteria bacterium]|nr:NAD(P)-dependent oxidoreductase [Deltaproteobacteria bacterium]
MDVFFYEAFDEETDALRRHLPHGIVADFTPDTIQESRHRTPPAGIISIRTQSYIPPQWAGDVKAILSRSTGYDHVLSYRTATGMDTPAGYLPLYCNRAVAEQALLLWLGLLRRLPAQTAHLCRFDRDGLTGSECMGKTILVVGVGNIGSEVCRIGSALGMEVFGADIVRRHPSIRYSTIETILPCADVIVCAMNLTARNRGYFSYDLLRKAKPGAVFVNIARGELADTAGLLRLLNEGHLGGVGLDVYENEGMLGAALRSGTGPLDPSMQAVLELTRHDRAILTPHNAFNTAESVERKALQSVQQLENFVRSGEFIWRVPQE